MNVAQYLFSWKSKLYHKYKVLFEVPGSTLQVETYVKTMKGSHKLILEHPQMQASLKLWDSKFTPKPAIKKLMGSYSSECMNCLDNIKRGISFNKIAESYSTSMTKNKDKYPYLRRQHGQSPENWRSKSRSSSRGRQYMKTKPFGIETPRPTYSVKDRADWTPQPKETKGGVMQETPTKCKGVGNTNQKNLCTSTVSIAVMMNI